MTHLGVYGDNKPENVMRFDDFTGAPCAWIMGTIKDKMPGYGNVKWLWDKPYLGPVLTKGRWLNFSVGMWPDGGSRAQAAAGAYVEIWKGQARQFRDGAPRNPRGKVQIRLGWEFNIGFPWKPSSDADAAQWVAAFRLMVETYNAEAPGLFEWVWCPNYANGGINVELFYPGDAYVDIVGMDWYWKHEWEGTDPEAAWRKIRDAKFGLAWQVRFARAHGKMLQASEWAVPGVTKVGRTFLRYQRDWFVEYGYVEAGYWDSDKDTDGRLSNRRGPDTAAAFVEYFGMTRLPVKGGTTPPIVTPSPAPQPQPATQPAQPANPVLDLLGDINGSGERARSRYAEPVNGLIRRAEHMAWVALVAGGHKAGTPPAGEEKDPLRVLAAIYRLLDEVEPAEAEARTLIAGWLVRAEPLLEAAGLLPEPPAPQPVPDDAGAELEAMRRENETLRAQLAQAERANAVLQGRIRSGLLALSSGE